MQPGLPLDNVLMFRPLSMESTTATVFLIVPASSRWFEYPPYSALQRRCKDSNVWLSWFSLSLYNLTKSHAGGVDPFAIK